MNRTVTTMIRRIAWRLSRRYRSRAILRTLMGGVQ